MLRGSRSCDCSNILWQGHLVPTYLTTSYNILHSILIVVSICFFLEAFPSMLVPTEAMKWRGSCQKGRGGKVKRRSFCETAIFRFNDNNSLSFNLQAFFLPRRISQVYIYIYVYLYVKLFFCHIWTG